jgi:hypothetical protein
VVGAGPCGPQFAVQHVWFGEDLLPHDVDDRGALAQVVNQRRECGEAIAGIVPGVDVERSTCPETKGTQRVMNSSSESFHFAEGAAVTPDETQAAVFPLPLVPFERYMLADDSRRYPMTYFFCAEMDGVPDRPAMEAAFAEALTRHPLLTARVARRGWRWCWIPKDGALPRLDWDVSAAEPRWPVGERIDLRRDCGVRGYVHTCGSKSSLVLSFHHATCDGIGGLRFMGDVLACYGRHVAPSDALPLLLPVGAANLLNRDKFDIRLPEPVPRWVAFKSLVREAWKVWWRRPQVLGSRTRPIAAALRERPTLCVEHLDTPVYRRLCGQASKQHVTTNDLLLRDMFLTAHQWNATCGGGSRGWLRINMPTSLRGRRDATMPATNMLGYALVTRHTDECADPRRLLAAVAADTQAIRTWSLGALFVQGLRNVGRVPGLLPLGAWLGRRFATVVLSNLGDPSRRFCARLPRHDNCVLAGNLRVTSIIGAPPVRPGTRAALALFSYADRLAIALRYDPRWFSAAAARRFLDMYRTRLAQSAETSDEE